MEQKRNEFVQGLNLASHCLDAMGTKAIKGPIRLDVMSFAPSERL